MSETPPIDLDDAVRGGLRLPPAPADAAAASRVVLSSLTRFLNIFGDPWSILILRDVFLGISRFEAFQSRLGITRQTLSNRLRVFLDHGILKKVPYQQQPVRHAYRLTEKGRALGDFALMVWMWQTRWAGPYSMLPKPLRHTLCGGILVPQMVCAHCRSPVDLTDVAVSAGPGKVDQVRLEGRARRWAGNMTELQNDGGAQLLKGTYILGDRWNNLILASVLLGIRSFDEIGAALGISTNILSHRLKVCVDVGLLRKAAYNPAGRRFDYGLTEMSRELFPLFLSVACWSDAWLRPAGTAAPIWHHRACGERLEPIVTARCCAEVVRLSDIRFERGVETGR